MAVRFDEVIRALQDESTPLGRSLLRRLSNLGDDERATLQRSWGGIPHERRRDVLRHLSQMMDSDFDMDFSAVTRLALTDLQDDVREAAVEASWADETPTVFNRLMSMATVDSSSSVRAAALSALGRFILAGELGKFDPSLARQAENIAIRLYQQPGADLEVRRRALEAIANSSRPEVRKMIEDAYASEHARMRASAIYAMGRTCDADWGDITLRELASDDPAIRFEAVRAAGELELEEAVPLIAPFLTEGDRQMMETAVWALGEIGGAEARRLLSSMLRYAEDTDDAELLELVEDAIASASLIGGGMVFDA